MAPRSCIFVLAAALVGASPARAERKVTGDEFVVEVETTPDAAVTVARVVITATGEYHVNREFPTSLEVTAGDGVAVDRAKQGKADAKIDDRRAVFSVRLTPKQPGSHAVTAKVRFAICTADGCLPRKANLTWTIDAR